MFSQPTRVYAPQPQAPVMPSYPTAKPMQPPVMRPMPPMGMAQPQMQQPGIMPLLRGGGRMFGMNANTRQF